MVGYNKNINYIRRLEERVLLSKKFFSDKNIILYFPRNMEDLGLWLKLRDLVKISGTYSTISGNRGVLGLYGSYRYISFYGIGDFLNFINSDIDFFLRILNEEIEALYVHPYFVDIYYITRFYELQKENNFSNINVCFYEFVFCIFIYTVFILYFFRFINYIIYSVVGSFRGVG